MKINLKFVFLLSLLWYGLFYWAYYPGIYSWDGMRYLFDLKGTNPTHEIGTESIIYGGLLYFFGEIDSNFSTVHLIQVLLGCSVLTYGYHVLTGFMKNSRIPLLIWLGILFLPGNGCFLMWTERDVLYSWLGLFCIFQVLNICQKKFVMKNELLLILTIAVATCIRKEAILWLPVILLALRPSPKIALKNAALFLGIGLIIWLFPFLVNQSGWEEQFNPMVHQPVVIGPISYIVKNLDRPLSDVEIANLSPYIDLEELNNLRKDPFYPYAAVKGNQSKADFLKFIFFSSKLIAQNPKLFLESRLHVFKIGLEELDLTDENPYFPPEYQEQLTDLRAQSNRHSKLYKALSIFSSPNMKNYFVKLLYSPFLGVVLTLLALFFVRRSKYYFFSALLPLCQLLTVFLFQPDGKSKFLYLLYLYFPLGLGLLIFEIKRRKNELSERKVS